MFMRGFDVRGARLNCRGNKRGTIDAAFPSSAQANSAKPQFTRKASAVKVQSRVKTTTNVLQVVLLAQRLDWFMPGF